MAGIRTDTGRCHSTGLAAVNATLGEGEPPIALPSQDPGLGSQPNPDHLLRIAKWHLAQIESAAAATTPAAAALLSDHADVVTVYSAARIEAGLNTFIGSPLLFMNEEGRRRFVAKIMTKYLRLPGPQKIKFLRDQVPTLKGNNILTRAEALCGRRNRILHTSLTLSNSVNTTGRRP